MVQRKSIKLVNVYGTKGRKIKLPVVVSGKWTSAPKRIWSRFGLFATKRWLEIWKWKLTNQRSARKPPSTDPYSSRIWSLDEPGPVKLKKRARQLVNAMVKRRLFVWRDSVKRRLF